MPDGNGWSEYQQHVLAELKRLNGLIEDVREDVVGLRIQVSAMDAARQRPELDPQIPGKGFWLGLAGLLAAIGTALWEILRGGHAK